MQEKWLDWLKESRLDDSLHSELQRLIDQDERQELEERFASELHFGTGGLRAKMGVGTNRMNIYTVGKATAGVVGWIKSVMSTSESQSVAGSFKIVIGYDGRRDSDVFARRVAAVANAMGVTAYVFAAARPTPLLSFAVRQLSANGGIMVTASHNPPEYNGYKVYGADGGQLLPDDAEIVTEKMREIKDMFDLPAMDIDKATEQGLYRVVQGDVEQAYFGHLSALYRPQEGAGVRHDTVIVYTPLHGTGASLVPRALNEAGFAKVHMVAAQASLDSEFTNVLSPNPEEPTAYNLAIEEAKRVGADVILATDPDADRVGVMARSQSGEYKLLAGNEVGALILDNYLAWRKGHGNLPDHPVMVTTNVTSDFGEVVANEFGVKTERVLTGFKFICAKIREYEQAGDQTFVFGYEESVGYLALPFVRDKDSVQGAVVIANMVAELKAKGATLVSRLEELRQHFGYFSDRLLSYTFPGLSGLEQMQTLMDDLRKTPLVVPNMTLTAIDDCLRQTRIDVLQNKELPLDFPESDVLKYLFQGDAWVAVRPSGTEPKLKVYLGVRGQGESDATSQLEALLHAIDGRVRAFMEQEG